MDSYQCQVPKHALLGNNSKASYLLKTPVNPIKTSSLNRRKSRQKTAWQPHLSGTHRSRPISYYFPAVQPNVSANALASQQNTSSSPSVDILQDSHSTSTLLPIINNVQSEPTPSTLQHGFTLQPHPTDVSNWHPNVRLPVKCSDHSLDTSCHSCDLVTLKHICTLPPLTSFIFLHNKPLEHMTVQVLQQLLSPTSTINQQAIQLYLHCFCSRFQTTFLDNGFFTQLRNGGWSRVQSWFSSSNPERSRRGKLPLLSGESAISIPCHVNNCHWVAVTRREVGGKVLFLYADDTNNSTTKLMVKNILSSSHPVFSHPPHSG